MTGTLMSHGKGERMHTSLEVAEQEYDRAMQDPAATWDQKFAATVRFWRRAFYYRDDQDRAIAEWLAEHPMDDSTSTQRDVSH
jgi:hypothetical protein